MGEEFRLILKEHGIEENVVPYWMPEGFKMQGDVSVKELDFSKGTQFYAFYSDETDVLTLTVERHVGQTQTRIYEKIDDTPEVYIVGNKEHYIFSNTDTLMVVWYSGDIECFINTTLSESDVKRVVDSIYEE